MEIYYSNKMVKQNFISPLESAKQPLVRYPVDSNSFYTLILYDPNAVTSTGYYIHWVITNIPGNSIKNGDTVLSYTGPHPPKNSGIHHYIFSLYKQRSNFSHVLNPLRTECIHSVLSKLNLNLRTPIYADYFLSYYV